jgi:hypothetical protein
MRSIKLTTATAAAAALLTLAPAAALAGHRHLGRRGAPASGCRLVLNVAPRLITAGDTTLAFGHLSCANAEEEVNQTVTLYQNPVGAPGGFTVAGTTTTLAHGVYDLSTAALSANSRFYAVADGAQSPTRTVRVQAQVILSGPADGADLLTAGLRTGRRNRVAFSGKVTPEDVGAVVVLQRQNALTGNEWHRIQLGTVEAGGNFSIIHAFVVPGDANIRVLIRSQRRNVPSPSNELNYEISQAENPQLTIASSANPIAFGQSTVISGKLEGAANTPVTLLAHTVHQGGFAPVAQVKTNGSDEYAFPAQSPVDSTFYEVQGGGRTSAVLYEGVKDVLTATVSPEAASIQAGETLTFSGTVSPDHTGHLIYLERQNPSGTGFNVVEVSTVASGSVYSIPYIDYNLGTNVFRMRVPADPQNGGAVSQLFTIQVTQPTAAALTPEPPSNSTPPPEGQV